MKNDKLKIVAGELPFAKNVAADPWSAIKD